MTVVLPGLEKSSQTLKIRLLPGKPSALRLTFFSDGFDKIKGEKGIASDFLAKFFYLFKYVFSVNCSFIKFLLVRNFDSLIEIFRVISVFLILFLSGDSKWFRELECENGSEMSMGVEVVDLAGNVTLKNNLIVQCKVMLPSRDRLKNETDRIDSPWFLSRHRHIAENLNG